MFPVLKAIPTWFPGAKFHQVAAKLKKLAEDARTHPFAYTQAQMVGCFESYISQSITYVSLAG